MWNFERTSKYRKQYKALDLQLQNKVKEALTQLANSKNPRELGEYKPGLKVYAYDLDKSNRILYDARFSDNIIELYRVGDHKQTYGRD